jgi:putative oxygen-independent coproporphyrinogen III oxidase
MTAGASTQRPRGQRALGVYVHFPWCLAKCPYCDFLSVTAERPDIPHDAYADAVIRELDARAEALAPDADLETIFFGGGTPSLWEPEALGRVLGAILHRFEKSPGDVEATVECNPSSFDGARARRLVEQGVSRVSLGVQSLDSQRLAFLGRLHDGPAALAAIDAALDAKVPKVSADLIFGVAGQSPLEAAEEARVVASRGLTHVSAYALTIESGTVFGARARRGKLPLLDEAAVADSFKAVEETLEGLGFAHYEVSNYAAGGHTARHNLGYWRGVDYLGLGTGAFGTVSTSDGALRYRNTPSPERYLAGTAWGPFDQEGDLVHTVERLTPETLLSERILLGLRTAEGVDIEAAGAELGLDPWTPARLRAAERWIARGRLERHGGRLRIPPSTWLLSDGVTVDLL